MKQTTITTFIAALILLCGAPVRAQSADTAAEPKPVIKVRLYDYVGISRGALSRSIAEVDRVFAQARVQLVWADCSLSLDPSQKHPFCRETLNAETIFLRFLPREMGKNVRLKKTVFGFVVPAQAGQFVHHASILFDRVQDCAIANGLDVDPLLAGVMAHEIGHLLLGRGSHFKRGLMRCPWTLRQLKEVAQGLHVFTPEQADLVHHMAQARANNSLADVSTSVAQHGRGTGEPALRNPPQAP